MMAPSSASPLVKVKRKAVNYDLVSSVPQRAELRIKGGRLWIPLLLAGLLQFVFITLYAALFPMAYCPPKFYGAWQLCDFFYTFRSAVISGGTVFLLIIATSMVVFMAGSIKGPMNTKLEWCSMWKPKSLHWLAVCTAIVHTVFILFFLVMNDDYIRGGFNMLPADSELPYKPQTAGFHEVALILIVAFLSGIMLYRECFEEETFIMKNPTNCSTWDIMSIIWKEVTSKKNFYDAVFFCFHIHVLYIILISLPLVLYLSPGILDTVLAVSSLFFDHQFLLRFWFVSINAKLFFKIMGEVVNCYISQEINLPLKTTEGNFLLLHDAMMTEKITYLKSLGFAQFFSMARKLTQQDFDTREEVLSWAQKHMFIVCRKLMCDFNAFAHKQVLSGILTDDMDIFKHVFGDKCEAAKIKFRQHYPEKHAKLLDETNKPLEMYLRPSNNQDPPGSGVGNLINNIVDMIIAEVRSVVKDLFEWIISRMKAIKTFWLELLSHERRINFTADLGISDAVVENNMNLFWSINGMETLLSNFALSPRDASSGVNWNLHDFENFMFDTGVVAYYLAVLEKYFSILARDNPVLYKKELEKLSKMCGKGYDVAANALHKLDFLSRPHLSP